MNGTGPASASPSPAPCPGLRQPMSGQGAPPCPCAHPAHGLPPSLMGTCCLCSARLAALTRSPAAPVGPHAGPPHALPPRLPLPTSGSLSPPRLISGEIRGPLKAWGVDEAGKTRGLGTTQDSKWPPRSNTRGGRRQPQDQPGREAATGWWQWQAVGRGPGAYLRRSCRLPAAGGRAGSGSRSPRRCCSTDPRSPRCQQHTHSRLRGGEAGERHTGTSLATHGHPKASYQ